MVTKRERKETPVQLNLSGHVARDLATILHVSTYHIASQETSKGRLQMKIHTEKPISFVFSFFFSFFIKERTNY